MKTRQQEQVSDFPYGWNKGDTCVMITNKAPVNIPWRAMTEDTSVSAAIPGFFIEPLRKDYSIQRKKRLQPWNNRKHRRRKEAE